MAAAPLRLNNLPGINNRMMETPMSTGKLLKAIDQYLECERASTGPNASDPPRQRQRSDLEAARRTLEAELQAYAEERSRPGMVKSILVAVDDSEPAQWAVDEAVRLAEVLDARVSLVHIIDVAPVLAPEYALDEALKHPALIQAAKELLRGLAERVQSEVLGEQIVREGNAAKQIITAASESRAGLLVIGTHGRGLLGRFLLGSVAEAVVRHSTCPVLTVGHPRQGVAPEPYAIDGGALITRP